jgi:hypothetical protein
MYTRWSRMSLEQNSPLPSVSRRRFISKVLGSAVQLWLRTQVESAETLQVQIEGGDWQILSGYIPTVTIAAEDVVYQGIALHQIFLRGTDIRVNLKDVLQGKPLQLLDVVPVQAEATLNQAGINTSLRSPQLASTIKALVIEWLRLSAEELPTALQLLLRTNPIEVEQPQLAFHSGHLRLWGRLVANGSASQLLQPQDRSQPFAIKTGLNVIERSKIQLDQPQWLSHPNAIQGEDLSTLQNFEIDLGTDVCIHRLSLEAGQLVCGGIINVIP